MKRFWLNSKLSHKPEKGTWSVCKLAVCLTVGTLVLYCCAPPAGAQTAKYYLDAAVTAIGGIEAILALDSQRIIAHGENFEPAQAVRPGAQAPKVSTFRYTLLYDFSTGRFRYEWQRDTLYPFAAEWSYTEISDGYSGVILGRDGIRSPEHRPASAARIAARKKELSRASPVSVLLTGLSRQTSLLRLRDEVIRGRLHYVISYEDAGKPVIVSIDAETRLLTRVQFIEADPLHGGVHNELFFSDWRQVGDLRLPFALLRRIDGKIVMTEQIESIENNVTLLEGDFTIPRDVTLADNGSPARGEHSSHWILSQIAMASPLDEEQTRIRMLDVAPGVVHVTGGTHHSLGIEMKDHVIAVEAPLYEARSTRVIDSLERRFPGKPIRAVVNTHFHNDHAGGLRTYVAAGIPVVTSAMNAQFFATVFGAQHSILPDRLHKHPKQAVIKTVGAEKKIMTDGKRIVEIYPVENSHAEDMLMVFLPQEKLLYVTDLFSPGAPRQVQTWSHELLTAIQRSGLDVEHLVGGHGSVAPISDLLEAAASHPAAHQGDPF